MNWRHTTAMVGLAAGLNFAVALAIFIMLEGYGDDAFSMALALDLIAIAFIGPGVWLKQFGAKHRTWIGVQTLLSLLAVALAAYLNMTSEARAMAGPFLLSSLVPIPVFYLAAGYMCHRTVLRVSLLLLAVAVVASLPIARL